MIKRRIGLLAILLAAAASCLADGIQKSDTPKYRDLFHEYLGKSDGEVSRKIDAAWHQLFYGDDQSQRIYYPVEPNLGYIADTGNEDVRTEGMSYGMMIAVQTNHQAEFDRIWRWAKVHMYNASGPYHGYFGWQSKYNGEPIDHGPAPDGEQWFIMALFFAAGRWGDTHGDINYRRDANQILHEILHHTDGLPAGTEPTDLFNHRYHQVVFVPTGPGSHFTDASYHLPAFYTLWSEWADEDRDFWKTAAQTSRNFFHRAANPKTGLIPDYSDFDGTPHESNGHGDFRFDAWRTISNVAFDYSWFRADPWAIEQSNRVLNFLAAQGPDFPNQYAVDGKPLSNQWSPGLSAMAAVGALAADEKVGRPFVERLWTLPIPAGKYRYYDGALYFLALLEVSGNFQVYSPR